MLGRAEVVERHPVLPRGRVVGSAEQREAELRDHVVAGLAAALAVLVAA
jgi:hypothetical protein